MAGSTRADYASAAGSARHADRASVATTAQEATTAGTADRALFTRGILSSQLSTLLGREDGDTVLTMGQDAPSDGLGKQFRWDAASVLAEVVGSVYGTSAQGRWIQAGTVTSSSGGSSGTSVTFTNPANGQLTAASIGSAVLLVVDGSVGGDVATTGFIAPATGGQLVKELRNNRATNWVIKHQDSGATAANRVITPDGVDFLIGPGESATIAYDTAAARYVVSASIARRAATADKALIVEGYTTTEVYALATKRIGAIYQTTGLASDIDKKPLRLVCVTGSASVDKIVTVWSGTDLLGAPCHLRVMDPYPCYPMRTGLVVGDGVADDSDGLETMLETAGIEFVLEDGAALRVTRELAPTPAWMTTIRAQCRRQYSGAPEFLPGAKLVWDGPGTDGTMLKLASAWQSLLGLSYTLAAGRTLGRFIDFCGYLVSTTGTGTVAAGSTTSAILVTGGGLAANTLAGRVLLIGGEYRLISANTASSITVSTPFTTAPSAGTAFSITQWVHGTRLTIEDATFQPGYVSFAWSGSYKQAVTVGYNPSFGNGDFMAIRRANIRQFDDCAVWLRDGQPLGTVLDGVLFAEDGRLNASSQPCCYGTGIRLSTVAASVTLRDMVWGPLAVGIDSQAEVRVWLDGSQDGEYLKRFAQGARLHLSSVGGRVESAPPLAYGIASAAPIIAADDNAWIDTTGGGGGGSLCLANFQPFSGENWCIRANSNCRIDLRCIGTPVRNFLRIGAPDGNGQEADVTVLGGAHVVTASEDQPPGGTTNDNTSSIVASVERHLVTISDDGTVAGVDWYYRRPTIPLLDPPRLVATTGTPASGALTGAVYQNTLREGSTLKLAAAPGAGASVTYEVIARPNRRQDREPTKVFERMAVGTARRETASGTSGLAAGSTWWVAALAARLYEEDPSPGANVEEALWCLDDGAGNPFVSAGIIQPAAASYFLPYVRRHSGGYNYSTYGAQAPELVARLFPVVVTYSSGQLRGYFGTAGAALDATVSIAALAAGARIRLGGAGGSYANKWGLYGVAAGTGAFATRVEGPTTIADAINRWIWTVYRTRRWQPPTDTGLVCTHSWRTDGSATLTNQGSAGAAGNVTTISGTVATKSFQWTLPQYAPEPLT